MLGNFALVSFVEYLIVVSVANVWATWNGSYVVCGYRISIIIEISIVIFLTKTLKLI